jgi:lysophospholipid acyltransferase (LPLAT)-like uncharacterized protein
MPNREAAWRRWAPSLVAALIRGVGKTLRIETVNGAAVDARWRKGEAAIIAFWHGRQLMLPLAYHGRGLSILISRHRDGELIARAMRAFGFSSVRGSTTRGGSSALRGLVAEGRRGRDLAVTPDGPKGPRGVVQPGVIQLARLTGLPVFPLAFGASKKKSWTRGTAFSSRIPLPAACCAGAIPSGCRATWMPRDLRSAAAPWSGR